MNLSEFKAWFEGFTENISGRPSDKQWKRIKKRVGEITSDPTPWPVFVERYIEPRPYRWWFDGTTWGGVNATLWNGPVDAASRPAQCKTLSGVVDTLGQTVTIAEAFNHVGRMEAAEIVQ